MKRSTKHCKICRKEVGLGQVACKDCFRQYLDETQELSGWEEWSLKCPHCDKQNRGVRTDFLKVIFCYHEVMDHKEKCIACGLTYSWDLLKEAPHLLTEIGYSKEEAEKDVFGNGDE